MAARESKFCPARTPEDILNLCKSQAKLHLQHGCIHGVAYDAFLGEGFTPKDGKRLCFSH